MPSPFPGMNPYLESPHIWRDFHDSFLPRMRDALNAVLGDRYFVRIEENVYIREPFDNGHRLFAIADAAVSTPGNLREPVQSTTAVVDAPVQVAIRTALDLHRETFLESRTTQLDEVITVIELLSPTIKSPGRNRGAYLFKREPLLLSGTHLVEIDLLRGGERMPFESFSDCDYYALVSRVEGLPSAGFWPIHWRDRLPKIGIPLRSPDADVSLDLQAVLNEVYDAARYAKVLYRHSPEPALNEADAAWAKAILTARH